MTAVNRRARTLPNFKPQASQGAREVERTSKALPEVPTEEELRKFYDVVWKARNTQDLLIIKILLYTGARVSELVNIKLTDVDLDLCQIRIRQGKGGKDRVVPFPDHFKETAAHHIQFMKDKGAAFLFESSWKKPYSDRGIRKMLERYAEEAGLEKSFSPHKMRHFLLSWLKKQGIDDALIQPYSGHASRKSLEYTRACLFLLPRTSTISRSRSSRFSQPLDFFGSDSFALTEPFRRFLSFQPAP